MEEDFSWAVSAGRYLELYNLATESRGESKMVTGKKPPAG